MCFLGCWNPYNSHFCKCLDITLILRFLGTIRSFFTRLEGNKMIYLDTFAKISRMGNFRHRGSITYVGELFPTTLSRVWTANHPPVSQVLFPRIVKRGTVLRGISTQGVLSSRGKNIRAEAAKSAELSFSVNFAFSAGKEMTGRSSPCFPRRMRENGASRNSVNNEAIEFPQQQF